MNAPKARRYGSIEDIKRHNSEAGQHFFSASTLRFFGSRVLPTLYGAEGALFVTSERQPDWYDYRAGTVHTYPRLYTVRVIGADGRIDDIGGFQAYISARQAQTAARKAAL